MKYFLLVLKDINTIFLCFLKYFSRSCMLSMTTRGFWSQEASLWSCDWHDPPPCHHFGWLPVRKQSVGRWSKMIETEMILIDLKHKTRAETWAEMPGNGSWPAWSQQTTSIHTTSGRTAGAPQRSAASHFFHEHDKLPCLQCKCL